ncbi:MAG TPA: DnaJ C-terminal domain-containing protein [Candidatus Dormibacteraeota bacterium]
MPKTKDYYDTLGVARNATKKDIQAAFRKLARQYHPDANPGDKEAEKRFKEISQAHDVLANAEKRKLYDAFGEDWQAAQAAGVSPDEQGRSRRGPRVQYQAIDPEELNRIFGGDGGGAADFGDLFGSIFGAGAGGGARAARRPAEAEGIVQVNLREAYTGTSRLVDLPDGRRLEVKVPAGVADGTLLRVPGLLARVQVTPDPQFRREDKDVHVQVAVSLRTALLGGEVQVPTLKGGRVHLTVKPETQNGARLRLRGLGMPDTAKGPAGDLIAEVKVRLPLPLGTEAKDWAQQTPD